MIPPAEELRRIDRDIVAAVVVSADDCILLGKKDPAKGGVYPNSWHLPGGGTDGEDLLMALGRELFQEINLPTLDGLNVSLLDDQGRGSSQKTLAGGEVIMCDMKFYVFKVAIREISSNTAFNPGSDLIELRWIPRTDLQNLDLTPPSRELFTRLGWIHG
jgi:8-oxo-dGTP pyrophosphatase MutT (NUDIX family)